MTKSNILKIQNEIFCRFPRHIGVGQCKYFDCDIFKNFKITYFLKFTVLDITGYTVSNLQGEATEEKEDPSILHKLTRWFSWETPLFGPIRTTPKPVNLFAPIRTTPKAKKQPLSVESGEEHHEISSDEAVHALDELYHMDGIKDILPPIDSLLDGEPIDEYDAAPIADINDPHVAEMIQNIIDYMQSRPHADDSAQSDSDSAQSDSDSNSDSSEE